MVVFGSEKSMETRREVVNHTQAQVTNITSNDVSLLFSEHHDDPQGDMEDKGMEDKRSKNMSQKKNLETPSSTVKRIRAAI